MAAAPPPPPHTDWGIILGLGLGAIGVIASVLSHKKWRAFFGVIAWFVLCATCVYTAFVVFGLTLFACIAVALIITAIAGAFAWRPVRRFLDADAPAWLALWCPNIDDLEATRHTTDHGDAVTLQIHIMNIGGRCADGASLEFEERNQRRIIHDLLPNFPKWNAPQAAPGLIHFDLEQKFFRKTAPEVLSLHVRWPTDLINDPIYWRLIYDDALKPTEWLRLTNYKGLPPNMVKRLENWGDSD